MKQIFYVLKWKPNTYRTRYSELGFELKKDIVLCYKTLKEVFPLGDFKFVYRTEQPWVFSEDDTDEQGMVPLTE